MFGAKSERRPNFAAAAVGKSLHLGPETRRRGPEIDDRRRPENKIGQTKNRDSNPSLELNFFPINCVLFER